MRLSTKIWRNKHTGDFIWLFPLTFTFFLGEEKNCFHDHLQPLWSLCVRGNCESLNSHFLSNENSLEVGMSLLANSPVPSFTSSCACSQSLYTAYKSCCWRKLRTWTDLWCMLPGLTWTQHGAAATQPEAGQRSRRQKHKQGSCGSFSTTQCGQHLLFIKCKLLSQVYHCISQINFHVF